MKRRFQRSVLSQASKMLLAGAQTFKSNAIMRSAKLDQIHYRTEFVNLALYSRELVSAETRVGFIP